MPSHVRSLRHLALLLALALAGCTSFPFWSPRDTTETKTASELSQGTLKVRIKWPERDLPNFQAQTIPLRTRSIRLIAQNSKGDPIGETLIERPAEATAESTGSLRLAAGLDYRLQADAFAEGQPTAESVAIASGNATNIPIVRSRTTVVSITLTAAYAPAVTAMEPSYGLPGTLITIRGTNFGASKGLAFGVDFGGVTAQATRSSDTALVAKVPSGFADKSKVNIRVTVDGVPSTSTALFIVGSAGFDATLVPIEDTWGNNGLSVGMNSGSSDHGLATTLEASNTLDPEGLAPILEAATASSPEGFNVTIE